MKKPSKPLTMGERVHQGVMGPSPATMKRVWFGTLEKEKKRLSKGGRAHDSVRNWEQTIGRVATRYALDAAGLDPKEHKTLRSDVHKLTKAHVQSLFDSATHDMVPREKRRTVKQDMHDAVWKGDQFLEQAERLISQKTDASRAEAFREMYMEHMAHIRTLAGPGSR
jgi:hypothetical protein